MSVVQHFWLLNKTVCLSLLLDPEEEWETDNLGQRVIDSAIVKQNFNDGADGKNKGS